MTQVIFKGFKNMEEAEAFALWYIEGGEQDFSTWQSEQNTLFTGANAHGSMIAETKADTVTVKVTPDYKNEDELYPHDEDEI